MQFFVRVIKKIKTIFPTKSTTLIPNLPSKMFSGVKNRQTDKIRKKSQISGFKSDKVLGGINEISVSDLVNDLTLSLLKPVHM